MTTTWPIFAVTCRVPPASSGHLHVEVAGRTVTAVGPSGFRHTFELPAGAATDQLEWRIYGDILEVRVPFASVDE